jgi:hypothetical protein
MTYPVFIVFLSALYFIFACVLDHMYLGRIRWQRTLGITVAAQIAAQVVVHFMRR